MKWITVLPVAEVGCYSTALLFKPTKTWEYYFNNGVKTFMDDPLHMKHLYNQVKEILLEANEETVRIIWFVFLKGIFHQFCPNERNIFIKGSSR